MSLRTMELSEKKVYFCAIDRVAVTGARCGIPFVMETASVKWSTELK